MFFYCSWTIPFLDTLDFVLKEDCYDIDEECAKESVENAESVLGYEDPGLEPDLYSDCDLVTVVMMFLMVQIMTWMLTEFAWLQTAVFSMESHYFH